MIGITETPRAWWTAHGMARSAGIQLARAVVQGVLSRQDLAQIVGRCQSCGRTSDCTAWLSQVRDDGIPEFCAIKPELDLLGRYG